METQIKHGRDFMIHLIDLLGKDKLIEIHSEQSTLINLINSEGQDLSINEKLLFLKYVFKIFIIYTGERPKARATHCDHKGVTYPRIISTDIRG